MAGRSRGARLGALGRRGDAFGFLRAAQHLHDELRHSRDAQSIDAPLLRDLARLEELWADGFGRFGGPFLTGARFCAVDAFFAPVAFRIQTYEPPLNAGARRYAAQLLALPSMKDWYAAALAETWRDEEHEVEARGAGEWREDLRARY